MAQALAMSDARTAAGCKYRVLLVCSHPVQYAAPVFRRMAQHPRLDIQVAYCSLQGAEPAVDSQFGVTVAWDVPLLEGYPWVHVPNKSPRAGLGSFLGLAKALEEIKTGRGSHFDPQVVDAFLDLIATDTVHLPLPTKDQGQKLVPSRPDEPVQTAA